MNYKKLVQPNTFIGQYMEAMSDLETPLAYDFWSAIWCISSVVGRDVYVDRPQIPVRLNEYIILVAESGITRKGANINLAMKVVDGMVPELVHNKTTSAQLDLLLHEQTRLHGTSSIAICCPEMTSVLGRDTSLKHMPELLTDIYDCHDKRIGGGSIERGKIYQERLYPTILTASTPAWLGTAINPSVIEGGFTSRCIFVCERKRKRIVPWPSKRSGTVPVLRDILSSITGLAQKHGGIGTNNAAIKYFSRWYRTKGTSDDPFRSSFEAREDDHVLRLAALLCINDGTFELQVPHIKNSIRIIEHIKQSASDMFGEDKSRTVTIGDGIEKLREFFEEWGSEPVPHTKLYTKMRWRFDIEEFKLVMSVMHETGMIEVFERRNSRGKFYKATKKLLIPGALTEAVQKLSLNHRGEN